MGSHLNINKEIECDASILQLNWDNIKFGSVGALKGIMKPSNVCLNILQDQISFEKNG